MVGLESILVLFVRRLLIGAFGLVWGVSTLAQALDEISTADYDTRLVALLSGGQDLGAVFAYWPDDEDYFLLPADELFEILQLTAEKSASQWGLETPAGRATISTKDLVEVEGILTVSNRFLRDQLAIRSTFNARKYAIELVLPWWKKKANQSRAENSDIQIDFAPPVFSISQFRTDINHDIEDASTLYEFIVRGNLAGGIWHVDFEQQDQEDVHFQHYFWLHETENQHWLLGKRTQSIGSLLPTSEHTGVQFAYSNRSVPQNDYNDITRNSFVRNLGMPIQDVSGKAPAGAIIELRQDDRLLGFTRAHLDGQFLFEGLIIDERRFAKLELFIRDPSSLTVIEVRDISSGRSKALLQDQQVVIYTGVGVDGDPLTTDQSELERSEFAIVRMGLSDQVSIEAGAQKIGDDQYHLLGIDAAIGKRVISSASIAEHDGKTAFQLAADYEYNRARASLSYEEVEAYFRDNEIETSRLDAQISAQINQNLTAGVLVRSEETTDDTIEFALPFFYWRQNEKTNVRLRPNREGEYRLDIHHRPRPLSMLHYSFEEDEHGLNYRQNLNDSWSVYSTYSDPGAPEQLSRLELGLTWIPEVNGDHNQFKMGLIAAEDGDMGYVVEVTKEVYPGLLGKLTVVDEPALEVGEEDSFSAFIKLSTGYSISKGGLVPALDSTAFNRTGAIDGHIYNQDQQRAGDDIERVSLLLNGLPHQASVANGAFHIDGLRPGTYRMRLDNEFLPIEWVARPKSYWVKVDAGAATHVELALSQEFGAAGKISDAEGRPIVAAELWVKKAAEPGRSQIVKKLRSDQFGYYRVDGLVAGDYVLQYRDGNEAGKQQSTEIGFTIDDAFIFDQNIVVP